MRVQWYSGMFAVSIGLLSSLAHGQQGYEWSRDFNSPLFDDTIYDGVEWDDGTGSALYIAGEFTSAYGDLNWSIIKYDGQNWSPVGSGLRFVDPGSGGTFEARSPLETSSDHHI